MISTWADGDTRYVFLPAYAHMVYITALVRPRLRVSLDGYDLTEKSDLSRYAIGEPYNMRVRTDTGESCYYILYFLRSANLPAMYIDTSSGGMDAIHADKEYRESVRVALVSPDGTRLYSGVNDTIHGHGQASWSSDKKSYSLKLRKPKGLLGMAYATKWTLISNTRDPTSMRNKFVMDMAAKTGLEWSPSCEYIDLYLNGDYAGLYLLSERIENNENRLNLSDQNFADNPGNASGGDSRVNFLCKIELAGRQFEQPFLTENNRYVVLLSPNPATEEEWDAVRRDTQSLEDTILSGDEQKLLYYLDLDSWVRRYLIDEISENIDAEIASSYFYCVYNGNQPVFYGGPVWDYDWSFGNNNISYRGINPKSFFANTERKSENLYTPWFHALYQYDAFYSRVCELYQEEFRPLLEQAPERLGDIYQKIRKASEMNQIRWYEPGEDISGRQILDYITARVEFLDSAWIQNVNYHTIQIESRSGGDYLLYAVPYGGGFDDFPDASATQTPNDNGTEQKIIWYDRDTGMIYEPGTPIENDMILSRWNPNAPTSAPPAIGAELEEIPLMLELYESFSLWEPDDSTLPYLFAELLALSFLFLIHTDAKRYGW